MNLYNPNILPIIYEYTTEASPVILFASHAIVSSVYPLYAKKAFNISVIDYF
ncbi:MAG: hypothetical protein JZD40_07095 [Sulfolobus sp.]|nr:hypothetical protein [Sulfolobus sp.]